MHGETGNCVRAIVVVPARGSSRRIPRKILAPVGRAKLLQYTFDYVREEKLPYNTYFVTDDSEYASFVENNYPEVSVVIEPFVPAESENVLRAVYRGVQFARDHGDRFDVVVLLQPTNPLRPSGLVNKCINAITDPANSSLTVVPVPKPMEWTGVPDEHGLIRFMHYKPRQECEERFAANGSCYAYRAELFQAEPTSVQSFHSACYYSPVIVASNNNVDIDEFEDLEYLRFLVETGRVTQRAVGD